jgi:hypothetical protein
MKNIIFLLFILTSCNNELTPEKVLQKYITMRFNSSNNSSKSFIKHTTTPLSNDIQKLTGSSKDLSNFSRKYTYKKFSIITNMCKQNQTKCSIIFILVYHSSKQHKEVIELRKMAQLVKTDEGWKISDISNLKSYYDFKENINI